MLMRRVQVSRETYDVLGPFGWFYGDFFLDGWARELDYSGIYRCVSLLPSSLLPILLSPLPIAQYTDARNAGSAGIAIVSTTNAYLVTDSRYWSQARKELDRTLWSLIPAGAPDGPGDYVEWLAVRLPPFTFP